MNILEVIYTNTPWIKSPTWDDVIQQLADKTKEDPIAVAIKVKDWQSKNPDIDPVKAFKVLTGDPTAKVTGKKVDGVDLTKQPPEKNGEWIDQGRWYVSKDPILPGGKHEFAVKPDPEDMSTWGPNYKGPSTAPAEVAPKPVDGKCPTGYKLSTDGKSCVKDGSAVIPPPNTEEPPKPVDGKCPAGYKLSTDGKSCVKDTTKPAEKPEDNKVKLIWPAGSRAEINTNRPFSPPEHKGIDIKVGVGTSLVAPEAGTITKRAIEKGGAGLYLKLTSTDGKRVHIFMHLSKTIVDEKDTVTQGMELGETGGAKGTPLAGNSTGPHLHWGVKVDGQWTDPLTLVK